MDTVVYQNGHILSFGIKKSEKLALVVSDIIEWIGPTNNVPDIYRDAHRVNLGGAIITPTLIDCHTHLVYGSNRAHEFDARLKGASYADISAQGGGIKYTVAQTKATGFDDLLASALERVDALLSEGVCTIEIKSGYGLDFETERKMLMVAKEIENRRPIKIIKTFLGAHALPDGIKSDEYIKGLIDWLSRLHKEGLVDAVDAFIEHVAFSADDIRPLFEHAKTLHIPIKCHAEQLSKAGGTQLACEFKALSVDHLEYADQDDIRLMEQIGAIAVILPGAYYFLGRGQAPDISKLRSLGVKMAVATDSNPGSSPICSLLLAMNMSCVLFGLTVDEAFSGVTHHAAKALGLESTHGILEVGRSADFIIWDAKEPAEIIYQIPSLVSRRIFLKGKEV